MKREWLFFGQDYGLKSEGLQELSQTSPQGLVVLPGICIGASFYRDFLATNKFPRVMDPEQVIKEGRLPPNLQTVNQKILNLVRTGEPVAVRSSATNESGGMGIYWSDFWVPTGRVEDDMRILEEKEKIVYASSFSPAARAYLRKGEEVGMGILIQPVVGDKFGNYFLPALAGVVTIANRDLLVRISPGLGTAAIRPDSGIPFSSHEIRDTESFRQDIRGKVQGWEAIDLRLGKVTKIKPSEKMIEAATNQANLIQILVDRWEENFAREKLYYWEFAINQQEQSSYIVQSHWEKIPNMVNIEMREPEGRVFVEGTDMVNMGSKEGKGILVVGCGGYDPGELDLVKHFNTGEEGFLLITRDEALTKFYKPTMGFEHFSNAKGVVELQYPRSEAEYVLENLGLAGQRTTDHLGGKGGSHFAEICRRRDILFLGAEMGKSTIDFRKMFGEVTQKLGNFIAFWDIKYRITNGLESGRVELLEDPLRVDPLNRNLDDWEGEMYEMGSALNRSEDPELKRQGENFYIVFSLLADAGESLSQQGNALEFVEAIEEEKIPGMLAALQDVRNNLDCLESYDSYQQMSEYEELGEFPLEVFLRSLTQGLEKKVRKQ